MNYISRIQKLRKVLGEGLLEKEEAIALTLLCMIAGKSIFLYGPAGTAKSLVARRVSQAFQSHKFFDYLMNKFSTPEEVFGPLKLSELRKDNLERNIENFLPAADFAFLDEIFKSSPAILNALLTIINEKKFRNGKENIKVPLKALVAASNELPAKNQGLEALYDRFIMRLIVPRLEEKDNFAKLLQTLPLNEEIKLDEALKFSNDELENIKEKAKEVEIPKEIIDILLDLKARIENHNLDIELSEDSEDNKTYIDVSKRRWIAIMELLRFAVVLSDRTKMQMVDLLLIKHCLWSDEEQKYAVDYLLYEASKKSNMQKYHQYEFEIEAQDTIKSLEEKALLSTTPKFLKFLKMECEKTCRKFQAELDMIRKKKEIFCKENQSAFISQESTDFKDLLIVLEDEESTCEQLVIEAKKLYDRVENHPNIKG